MAKTNPKHRPGIHLFRTPFGPMTTTGKQHYEYYWHIVASNGRIIARSSETYTRKGNAVKGIRVVANVFYMQFQDNGKPAYYDHSQPDSPVKSYL